MWSQRYLQFDCDLSSYYTSLMWWVDIYCDHFNDDPSLKFAPQCCPFSFSLIAVPCPPVFLHLDNFDFSELDILCLSRTNRQENIWKDVLDLNLEKRKVFLNVFAIWRQIGVFRVGQLGCCGVGWSGAKWGGTFKKAQDDDQDSCQKGRTLSH